MEERWTSCVHRFDESVEYRCIDTDGVEGKNVELELDAGNVVSLPRDVFDENYRIKESDDGPEDEATEGP